MPPKSSPALNAKLLKISQRSTSPHEKSPCNLSTSAIKSSSSTITTIEEIKPHRAPAENSVNAMTQATNMLFTELTGKSRPPRVTDFLPPAQEAPAFHLDTFGTSNLPWFFSLITNLSATFHSMSSWVIILAL